MENLIKEVEAIVSPVYLVGGSVRDMLLKKTPKDYDFTTPVEPDEIERRVKAAGRRAYVTGKKFGTIGFKLDGQFIEVTTFRKEQYSKGSRKPEVVFVDDLKDDLSRRDFTINAIAYRNGEYFDPFGGRLDILEKKIKAVGDATDRFKEDPLRMLRAARFSAQLGFDVDPNAIGKIRKMADAIYTVSRERWVLELDKLLVTNRVNEGLRVLWDTYLLKYMLPEVWAAFDSPEYRYWLEGSVSIAPPYEDKRWAALFSCIGMPYTRREVNGSVTYPKQYLLAREVAVGICARLKFSNQRTKEVLERIRTTGT